MVFLHIFANLWTNKCIIVYVWRYLCLIRLFEGDSRITANTVLRVQLILPSGLNARMFCFEFGFEQWFVIINGAILQLLWLFFSLSVSCVWTPAGWLGVSASAKSGSTLHCCSLHRITLPLLNSRTRASWSHTMAPVVFLTCDPRLTAGTALLVLITAPRFKASDADVRQRRRPTIKQKTRALKKKEKERAGAGLHWITSSTVWLCGPIRPSGGQTRVIEYQPVIISKQVVWRNPI